MSRRVDAAHPERTRLFACLALAGLVLAVYGRILGHGFVILDDPAYVLDNPAVARGLSLEGLKWAFSFQDRSYWHPLTWLSLMQDATLWGLSPFGFHLTSLLLHLASVLLAFLVFARMTGRPGPSFLAAALFAVHPLHAESVAWVTERKDVLAAFFWMLTLWAWARYADRPVLPRLGAALVFLVLGLLSKPVMVTAPLVLLLVDFWPLDRAGLEDGPRPAPRPSGHKSRLDMARPASRSSGQPTVLGLITEKIPLALACLAVLVLVLLSHPREGLGGAPVPWSLRLSNAVVSYWWYLGKLVWPTGLNVYHPFPASAPFWKTAASVLGLVAVSVWVLALRRSRPHLAMGWFWFLITMLPNLKLYQMGLWYGTADRFAYIPALGIYLAVSFEVARAFSGMRVKRAVAVALGLAVFVPLALAGFRQAGTWKDSRTLFERALAVNPENWFARDGLGSALLHEFRDQAPPEALEHLQEAVRLNPLHADARYNMGLALVYMGRPREALGSFQEAVRLRPDFALAHSAWAEALNRLGLPGEALDHAQTAVKLRPDLAEAHAAWGVALSRLGRPEEALERFQRALELKPGLVDTRAAWGTALNQAGRPEEAVVQFLAALSVKPATPEALNNLGNSYLRLGRVDEALAQYQEALRVKPDMAEAMLNLGMVLLRQGKTREAVHQFQEALRLKPELADAHVGWAQALVRQRRLDDAVVHFEEALRIRPGDPAILAALEQARREPPVPVAKALAPAPSKAQAPAKAPAKNAAKAPAKARPGN